jgi:anthranilate phosphoribosyltransferase
MTSKYILEKLIQKKNLSKQEVHELVTFLVEEKTSTTFISAFLTAMTAKGETVEEMVECVKLMRQTMRKIAAPRNAIDVCGTGGDASKTFNVSTAVAFTVAACGIPVVKHGNRSVTSLSGSADVIEALGIKIQLTPEQAEKILKKTGMVFLFAPLFHMSFKKVSLVRKELGIRTMFNFLGPLVNPGQTAYQLIGVPTKTIAMKIAQVAKHIPYKKVCVVTSEDGMDEISLDGITTVFEVSVKKMYTYTINPYRFGFRKVVKEEIRGGTAKENAILIKRIFEGVKGPHRNIVVLNSAFSLYVAGVVKEIEQGRKLVEYVIDTGGALRMLEHMRKESNKYA